MQARFLNIYNIHIFSAYIPSGEYLSTDYQPRGIGCFARGYEKSNTIYELFGLILYLCFKSEDTCTRLEKY